MFVLLSCLLLLPADEIASWPGFLGAGHTAIDPDSIPLQWSPEKNLAWQAEIPGHGQSSPAIHGDRVFVTSCEGPNKELLHVLCLRLADGSILWDRELPSTNFEPNSLYISRAAPTPVVDSDRVVAYFESGDVYSLDHDGRLLWHESLTKKFGRPLNRFGLGASPVQHEDRVIILIDDEKPQASGGPDAKPVPGEAHSYILALRKADGKVVWKTDRTNRTSWSSPALISLGERPVVVCSSDGSVDGYDPVTGEQLFRCGNVSGNTACTPQPTGDGGFLVAASPGQGAGGERATVARQSNGLMQVNWDGTQWSADFVWRNQKATPTFSSPIVHQGHAYWVNRTGAIFCLDADSGELVYTDRLKQTAWATPLGLGDRVYFFGKSGTTTVIAAGPEFQVLATNDVWDPKNPPPDDSLQFAPAETGERAQAAGRFSGQTQYGVAAVTGSLLIRSGNRLFCIRHQP